MSKNISTSIYKLDRPYPILVIKQGIFLQVGVLFVVTDKSSPKLSGMSLCQETYPILASSPHDDIGRRVCEERLCDVCEEDLVHEGEKVCLTDLFDYFDSEYIFNSIYDDETDEYVYAPPFSTTNVVSALKEYGCCIFPPVEEIININLYFDPSFKKGIHLRSFSGVFFCVRLQDVVSTAKEFLRIIEEYSYAVEKQLKFNFTCHYSDQSKVDFVKKLNEYILAHEQDIKAQGEPLV